MQKRRAYVLSVLLGNVLLWSLFSCSIAKQTQTPQSTAMVVQSQASPTARSIAAGTLLYQANWAKGLDGWKGNAGWSVIDGQLQAQSVGAISIGVPYQPAMPYYAVETRAQIVRVLKNVANGFTIFASDRPGRDGYQGGVNTLAQRQPDLPPPGFAQVAPDQIDISAGFQQIDYVPGTNWHVYRIEVRGNEVSLSIDGVTVSSASSREKMLSTGPLGLRSEGFELHISSYRITAL